MLYRKNVGTREAVVRIFLGAVAIAFALLGIGVTPLGVALAASGGVMVLTGLFGYCPACALVGRGPVDRLP